MKSFLCTIRFTYLRAHFSWETWAEHLSFYGLIVLGRSAAPLTGPVCMCFFTEHVDLEDFLAQWPQLLCCFSDPWLNACKHTRHVSGLFTGDLDYTTRMLQYPVPFFTSTLRVWGFRMKSAYITERSVVLIPLLFTSQVVWQKKLWVHSSNKPQILFMIHCKSHLIALTDAVKSYLLIMQAFQWHQHFDHISMFV